MQRSLVDIKKIRFKKLTQIEEKILQTFWPYIDEDSPQTFLLLA